MAPPVEISIPSTSTAEPPEGSSSTKPFTLYNITLRLPLRSFVVQKRYSEFTVLHDTLTTSVGAAPPEPLPAKSWFRSTISSPEMTHRRQLGLEAYLRAIAESPDRRWRDTHGWRAFLNLPASSSAANSSTASASAAAQNIAAMDPTTWLDQHREMKNCLREARISLARRDAVMDGGGGAGGNSTEAAEAGAAAKRSLVRAGTAIAVLGEGLKGIQENGRLGDGEVRRRKDLLTAARNERDGLERLSNSMASSMQHSTARASHDRTELLGSSPSYRNQHNGAGGGRRVLGGAAAPETERTRELDNEGVLQLQKQEMASQDEQVRALAAIIRRQKDMGLEIQGEVELQTEMLRTFDDDVNRVQGKTALASKRIRKITGES